MVFGRLASANEEQRRVRIAGTPGSEPATPVQFAINRHTAETNDSTRVYRECFERCDKRLSPGEVHLPPLDKPTDYCGLVVIVERCPVVVDQ